MTSGFCRLEGIRAIFCLIALAVGLISTCDGARAVVLGAVSAQADTRSGKPQGKTSAINALSGSPWPGIIDHLLQKSPFNEQGEAVNANIHINYPSLGNRAVDTDIRNWVANLANTFESHLDASQFSIGSLEPDQNDLLFFQDDDLNSDQALKELPPVSQFELFGNYTVSRPSDAAISITFEIWNYINNNQGNLDILSLNYNLLNNQRLEFVDIFEDPERALELMSNWSRKKLAHRLEAAGSTQMLLNGTTPLLENFSNLTLVPEGVYINFQPYQVAPYEAGAQKVLMPLEELLSAGPMLALWGQTEHQ